MRLKMLSKDLCMRWIFRLCLRRSLSASSMRPISAYLSRTS